MGDYIKIKREDAIRALRHLEVVVGSLARLGSAATDMTREEYYRASSEFLEDWDVTRRLAQVRRLLSEQFSEDVDEDGMDELERELEGTPHWSFHARKPPNEEGQGG